MSNTLITRQIIDIPVFGTRSNNDPNNLSVYNVRFGFHNTITSYTSYAGESIDRVLSNLYRVIRAIPNLEYQVYPSDTPRTIRFVSDSDTLNTAGWIITAEHGTGDGDITFSAPMLVQGRGSPVYGFNSEQFWVSEGVVNNVPAFFSSTPPHGPRAGYLWYDTNENIGKIWNGSAWVNFSVRGSDSDSAIPTTTVNIRSEYNSHLAVVGNKSTGDKFRVIWQFGDSDISDRYYYFPEALPGIEIESFAFSETNNNVTMNCRAIQDNLSTNVVRMGFPSRNNSYDNTPTQLFQIVAY